VNSITIKMHLVFLPLITSFCRLGYAQLKNKKAVAAKAIIISNIDQ